MLCYTCCSSAFYHILWKVKRLLDTKTGRWYKEESVFLSLVLISLCHAILLFFDGIVLQHNGSFTCLKSTELLQEKLLQSNRLTKTNTVTGSLLQKDRQNRGMKVSYLTASYKSRQRKLLKPRPVRLLPCLVRCTQLCTSERWVTLFEVDIIKAFQLAILSQVSTAKRLWGAPGNQACVTNPTGRQRRWESAPPQPGSRGTAWCSSTQSAAWETWTAFQGCTHRWHIERERTYLKPLLVLYYSRYIFNRLNAKESAKHKGSCSVL